MKSFWFEIAVGVVVGLALAAFAYIAMPGHPEPYWILGLLVAFPLLCMLIGSHALLLVMALLFAGNFKTVPAQGITLNDPTMILLLLTLTAMLVEILLTFARIRRPSLASRFAGQGLGVLAYILLVTVVAVSLLYTRLWRRFAHPIVMCRAH